MSDSRWRPPDRGAERRTHRAGRGFCGRRRPDTGHWVFTGDTGPNPALWRRLAEIKLAHLIIETAFGDEEQQLASISRHLCPASLARELAQLKPTQPALDVHITHIKPGEETAVMGEIAALGLPHRVHALQAGQAMQF